MSRKGKVEKMSLESIGATNSSVNYADVVKSISRAPQVQVRAAEEVKKTAPSVPAATPATVAVEGRNAAMEGQANEEAVSSKIKDAVDKVNEKIVPSKTRCEFAYHEDTNRISIKVIDQTTDETIREIPAEETLDMLSRIWELAGLMVDEKR